MSRDSRTADQQVSKKKKRKRTGTSDRWTGDGGGGRGRFFRNIFVDLNPAATVVYFGCSPDMVK